MRPEGGLLFLTADWSAAGAGLCLNAGSYSWLVVFSNARDDILCTSPVGSLYLGTGNRDEKDESLVLAASPHVQSQPEYAIMAVKLLHFLDRGFCGLARDLAEEADRSSVSAAGSLAIIGQFRAFAGETEAALRCLDQAPNLVTRGSKAHLYTLTIKMQALRSVADFVRLGDAKRELCGVSAAAMLFYEPMFANPDKLSIRATKAVVMMLSRVGLPCLR